MEYKGDLTISRLRITVKGAVQGVGFRPFVYRLARSLGLKGIVVNTTGGVIIDVEGTGLDIFVEKMTKGHPPLARIDEVDIAAMSPCGFGEFKIIESDDIGGFTHVPPDVTVCGDCRAEMSSPGDRRFRYPFINCTNCGPRYTITKAIPYDRPNTTMSAFIMCPKCQAEYHDPESRRFHAQPNACPACGPRIEFVRGDFRETSLALEKAIEALRQGEVLAVKGLGGFHLACDATNEDAVNKLRSRKRRNNKPFALMAPDVEAVREFCTVSEVERSLLESDRRPIVLLRKKRGCALPEQIAPKNAYIGFMLPSTPLHYLLFTYNGASNGFRALVMTSGNLSEEPIVKDNDEALSRLSGMADAFLLHDRDIFMRVDDSVLRLSGTGLVNHIRRSRGAAPEPVTIHTEGPSVLGVGADLKNTFTLTKGSYAIPSQHIGDMDNIETVRFFEETLENLKSLYRVVPEALAHDMHPDYASTRWALGNDLPKLAVQHHYAHIASVMAEKGIRRKVIGVALDGTGYGPDGTLWGGEILICNMFDFRRAGHFGYIPLPGGVSAIRQPWRTAASYIIESFGSDAPAVFESTGFVGKYGPELENVLRIARNTEYSPLSSGAGRLFDAVAALIGLCDLNTFEGEAAMSLESLVRTDIADAYPVDVRFKDPMEIDFSLTIIGIVNDLASGVERSVISTKFHNTVIDAVLRSVKKISILKGIEDVVLGGGCFQNDYLLTGLTAAIAREGMGVHANSIMPPNDACISLGQAYILRERLKAGAIE